MPKSTPIRAGNLKHCPACKSYVTLVRFQNGVADYKCLTCGALLTEHNMPGKSSLTRDGRGIEETVRER